MTAHAWTTQHDADCPVTAQRASLLADLAQRPDDPYLLGALPEYDNGGDQEAEGCECRIDALVSAGHGEYGPTDPTIDYAWWPSGAQEEHLATAAGDDDDVLEQSARDLVRARTGLEAPDGVDFRWEGIVRIRGSRSDVARWYEALAADVANTPGGDDDTYDYWPSGIRLAQDVAGILGGGRLDALNRQARETLAAKGLAASDVGLDLDPTLDEQEAEALNAAEGVRRVRGHGTNE